MPRIVSLIASATEIVCALGCEDQLVGRSHECDFPPSVKRLPVLTSPKFDPDGTSYQIDQRVKAILQEGLSVYRVDGERLRELAPDVIVTQAQCEVCAVSLKDVEAAVCSWMASRPRVVSLVPNCLDDVWADVRRVAEAIDLAERGEELVGRLQAKMHALAEQVAESAKHPTVACVEWVEPLMAAGNWVPELVAMAGGVNLFGEAGKHAPWMTWEELRGRDPDVIVLMPCGFDLARTRQDVSLLEAKPGWRDVRAVRTGEVYVTDGNQFFNRPGPRLVESLEILLEILHPGTFLAGHEGTGWQRIYGR